MNIILLGPPGAGKGTEGELIAKDLGLERLSIGAMLRKAIEKKDSQGKEIENYIRHGLNVPSNLIQSLFLDWLRQNGKGFIIDNFPRSREQLETLKNLIQNNKVKIDKAIHMYVSEETSLKRLLNRREQRSKEGTQRIDESMETIKNRYRAGYIKDIEEILEYFRGLGVLLEVNAEGTIEEVHKNILNLLKEAPYDTN